jgi:transporter family protein
LIARKEEPMSDWFPFAIVAAVLYGLHQVFTKAAADRIGEGLGGLVVEGTAAATIGLYLIILWAVGRWSQKMTGAGFFYSSLTGLCVGLGTVAFFVLFQRGGPLSAVPGILAAGMAIMVLAGALFFGEKISAGRLLGIVLSGAGLFFLRR